MVLALLFVQLILATKVVNGVLQKELTLSLTSYPFEILMLLVITVFAGIVSGIYPALLLSSFKPIKVLNSSVKGSKASSILRTILVILQFALSIILMISAFTIKSQINYMNNKDLGYDKDQLVYATFSPTLRQNYDVIKQELLKSPIVENVSAMNVLPVYECPGFSLGEWEGKDMDGSVGVHTIQVEPDFLKTFNIELLEGRDFSTDARLDSHVVIVNQKAVEAMGMKDPLGKKLAGTEEIIGVINDFNYNTVRSNIDPLLIFSSMAELRYMFIKVNNQTSPEQVEKLNEILLKFDPDYSSKFRFFDQTLESLYMKEHNTGKLILYFTVLMILISCIGLFGLAGYITEQRKREIGIRKVMGASIPQIVFLLTSEFSKWILISIAIAVPISYYVMKNWLQNFAYKTDLSISVMFLAGFIALFVAIFTISFQTIKIALANPADSLKYE
jgi:ABC-type antimicrobial peptide transport system permease subunit